MMRNDPPGTASGAWRTWAVTAALVALVWVIYGQTARFEFCNYDDPTYILLNPPVLKGLTWGNLVWALGAGAAANWHPLTWLSHMADISMFGRNAGGHHLVSVFWHAANTVLLFHLLRAWTRNLWPSALVAALFAVHPAHVESVAWVAERKDVLSTFFMLLALAAYGGGRRRLALVPYGLGLMCKPMLVSLPLLLLLLDRWPLDRREPWRQLLREKVPYFLLAAASSGVTLLVQRHGGAVVSLERLPFAYRAGNAVIAYARYLGKLVWPTRLAVLYPLDPGAVRPWKVVAAVLLLAALGFLAWRSRRRCPWFWSGLMWFLVSLLPVLGLVQVGSQALADRYTYIPFLGPFLALAWGARDLAGTSRLRGRLLAAVGVAVVALLTLQARAQAANWHDSATLFQHALSVAPDNAVARSNLGLALFNQGHADQAILEYRRATELNPAQRLPRLNLARALAWRGRREEALAAYVALQEMTPEDSKVLGELALVQLGLGRLEDAVTSYQRVLALEPRRLQEGDPLRALDVSQDARMRIGMIYRALGREREAAPYFRAAAALNPSNPAYAFNLGISLAATGADAEAIRCFQRVLALQPGNADAAARLRRLNPKAPVRAAS